MAQMIEDDFYSIRVYPKARRMVVRFVGDCWEYSHEMTYNAFIRPLVRSYCDEWMSWDTRITLTEGYYVFTWEAKALDIKGDG